MATYTYHINLDERESFRSDVRDDNGNTIYEILGGDELGENETSLVEDGWMRHDHDMDGLTAYLRSLGIIGKADTITAA